MAPVPPPAHSGPAEFVDGKLFCYPAGWTDVAKFMLVNYGLHVVTTIPDPGGGLYDSIRNGVTAFTVPYYHVLNAIRIIVRSAPNLIHPPTDLERAHIAGALCMWVVYQNGKPIDGRLLDIELSVTSIPFHNTTCDDS